MKSFLIQLWKGKAIGWRAARISLMLCVGLAVCIMVFEERLIFFPAKYPEGFWDVADLPSREGQTVPKIEECYFPTEDGLRLHGWYATPHRNTGGELVPVPANMVLLWLHGNAGNITHRFDMLQALIDLPVNIFIIDYRGYGRSEGTPSEEGLYKDAGAAWSYLTAGRGIESDRIIILGKSLGGVPAVDLASKVSPSGLIVQSSFSSAADMAASVMPFLPPFMLKTRMESIKKIKSVGCPKLFIHSPEDEVVPFELGRRLFEAAPEPKQFYEVAGAGHNNTYIAGGRAYLDTLRAFVQSCEAGRKE